MTMKSYLMAFFFITLFGLSDARAQNLSQMVEKPAGGAATEPAAQIAVSKTSLEPIDINSTIVKVEVIGLRGLFSKKLPSPKGLVGNFIDTATDLTKDAYFQRKRFDETGQPIVIDRNHIYYRRDNYSYTKGIILWEMFNGRVDFGLYKKHFAPASTLISGKLTPDLGQQDSPAFLFRNGNRIFFSLRVKLSSP